MLWVSFFDVAEFERVVVGNFLLTDWRVLGRVWGERYISGASRFCSILGVVLIADYTDAADSEVIETGKCGFFNAI